MAASSNQLARQIAKEIVERSPSVAIRVSGPDQDFTTLFVTENISVYGYDKEEFMSGEVKWLDLVHPEDQPLVIEKLTRYEEEKRTDFSMVYRIRKADGSAAWITDSTIVALNEDGSVRHYDCIMRDYSETKSSIEKIEDSVRQKAVLNDILQSLHDTDVNRGFEAILKKTAQYLRIARAVLFERASDPLYCQPLYQWNGAEAYAVDPVPPFDQQYERELFDLTADLAEHSPQVLRDPEQGYFKASGIGSAALFKVNIQGQYAGFLTFETREQDRNWDPETLAFLENIAKLLSTALIRRQNEQVIHNMAITDQLTGLQNRYALEKYLNEALLEAHNREQSGYVLFIDMDDFKIINDGYGHDYGDLILKAFADFLKESYQTGTSLFRFGGDEFVILLQPEQADTVNSIINTLLARAQLPWNVLDKTFYCTLSIGVVAFPGESLNSKDIIKFADIAMYQAKRSGKNNYVFYNSTHTDDSIERAEVEKEMRESIDANFQGFSVFFQPQTDQQGIAIGAEALLRWTLSDGKAMPPLQFIPLAEYLGLIVPIGEFVLRESARICKIINETHPDFWISINVSIRQFQQQDFLERVLSIINQAGANPRNIIFEITEGMAMYDMARMKMLSEDFRKHGIRISMDDFGTGYSSLGNMRELPIDIVKIDRTFIRDITTDAYSKSFIRLIIDLVHSMGRKICIEGVETAEQLQYCRECKADYVQGFHLHIPVPLNEFEALIKSSQN